jgi:predicted ATP-grasp superfamily ATP-dependent carboligase
VIEDAPAYGVLAGVRALRQAGYDPWVAYSGPGTYARRSRACGGARRITGPARSVEAFAQELAELAGAIGAAVVLPGTERATVALAGEAHRFPDAVRVGVAEPELVRRATDKRELARLGMAASLRSPEINELQGNGHHDFSEFDYPLVVKTRRKVRPAGADGLEADGVVRVEEPHELERLMADRQAERLLVQPFISSGLEAVCGVAWGGEMLCAVHQVAERIYPADAGVSAAAHTVAPDLALEQRVRQLIELMGWSGLFEVQVLRSGRRRYLIDFNTHMYGSLSLAVAAGLNLPALWVECLLGGTPACGGYRVGVRYRCEERDAAALIGAGIRGEWRTLAQGLRPHRDTVHAVCSLRDPLPALSVLRHVRRLARGRRAAPADAAARA